MWILVGLMVLMVGVVLVGLKVIWKDSYTTPPGKAGHLRLGWPAPPVSSTV